MNTSFPLPPYSDYGFDYSYPDNVYSPQAYLNMGSPFNMNLVPSSLPSTSTLIPAPSMYQSTDLTATPSYSTDNQYSTPYATGSAFPASSTSAYWTEHQFPLQSLPSTTTSSLLPSVSKSNKAPKLTKDSNGPTHRCSNCAATKSCQWRNVRSKDAILCNPCFSYKKKYKKDRSTRVAQAYQDNMADCQCNMSTYQKEHLRVYETLDQLYATEHRIDEKILVWTSQKAINFITREPTFSGYCDEYELTKIFYDELSDIYGSVCKINNEVRCILTDGHFASNILGMKLADMKNKFQVLNDQFVKYQTIMNEFAEQWFKRGMTCGPTKEIETAKNDNIEEMMVTDAKLDNTYINNGGSSASPHKSAINYEAYQTDCLITGGKYDATLQKHEKEDIEKGDACKEIGHILKDDDLEKEVDSKNGVKRGMKRTRINDKSSFSQKKCVKLTLLLD